MATFTDLPAPRLRGRNTEELPSLASRRPNGATVPSRRQPGKAGQLDGREIMMICSRLRCLTGVLASWHLGSGPIDWRDRGR